jgi:hypothetical protein
LIKEEKNMEKTRTLQEIIESFINGSEANIDMGFQLSKERKMIHDIARNNNLYSQTIDGEKGNGKRIIISKTPFIDNEYAFIREIKFLLEISIPQEIENIEDTMKYLAYDQKIVKICGDFWEVIKSKFEGKMHMFNEYKTQLIEKVKQYLKTNNYNFVNFNIVPDEEVKSLLEKRVLFVPENTNKKVVRFDIISAGSTIIGIKEWEKFIRMFTDIEILIKSKNFKRKLIADFADYNYDKFHYATTQIKLKLINNLLKHIDRSQFLSIGGDDIHIVCDDKINYDQLLGSIDPDKYFRKEIFVLKYMDYNENDFYVEIHENGTKKIKCLKDQSKKKEVENFLEKCEM